MADKSYIPASGESFELRRSGAQEHSIKKAGEAPKKLSLSPEITTIDHETKRITLTHGKNRESFWIYAYKNKRILAWPGGSIELEAQELSDNAAASGAALKPLKLTMPGKVLDVKVAEGDTVEAGAALIVVEAMKMENLLLATTKAKISKIHVKTGDRLESGATLISFEAP